MTSQSNAKLENEVFYKKIKNMVQNKILKD